MEICSIYPPNIKYFAIFCPSQSQDPQGGPRVRKWRAIQVEKSFPGFQDTEFLGINLISGDLVIM